MAKVIVGCKLPSGIVLEIGDKKIELAGANKDPRAISSVAVVMTGEMYGTTEVEDTVWKAWSEANKDFAPFKSGAIFVTKDKASAKSAAKDAAPTGLEGVDQASGGVAPADKE